MKIETVTLSNGVEMPVIGLGVYKSGEQTYDAVRRALELGYRHIDTAAFYGNEADVGRAVRDSGIPREEIFVTTKLWNDDQRAGAQQAAFEKSLQNLDLGYIDLYLNWYPQSEKIELVLCCMAQDTSEAYNVKLDAEQADALHSALPELCKIAYGYTPRELWENAVKEGFIDEN